MPPFYNIYALSKQRNQIDIEKFLNYFSYRNEIENRSGQEIIALENANDKNEIRLPINVLREVLEFGVKNSDYCFVFYINDNLKEDIKEVILKFTSDRQIIFGVSIESKKIIEDGSLVDNYDRACELEKLLSDIAATSKTSIQIEYAPADNEEEFDEDIHYWKAVNKLK